MKTEKLLPVENRPAWFPASFFTADRLFALVYVAVGYLFWECWWSAWRLTGWARPLAVFCFFYAAVVLAYLRAAGRAPTRESWFWLGVTLCLGVSQALPWGPLYSGDPLLAAWNFVALLAAAAYWTLGAAGGLVNGGTSNWLAFDLLDAGCVTPFGNFLRLPAALLARRKEGKRPWGAALGGGILGLLLVALALPSLAGADDGFARMLAQLGDWFSASFTEMIFKTCFAVPTGLYLYGLVYGPLHRRRDGTLWQKPGLCRVQREVRVLPAAAVAAALGVLCAVYTAFIALQFSYLFGAFFGRLPEGFTYASYARQGFFELCRVAALNAAVLAGAWVLARRGTHLGLVKLFSALLGGCTLLLLATAAAKLGMYVAAYGLTPARVQAAAGILWLLAVFCLGLARLRRRLPLVRWAVWLGAVLFCLLCLGSGALA